MSISPNTGVPAGGTIVTISGNFLGTTNQVTFGRNTAAFSISGGQVIATSPPGTGTVNVSVRNDVGTTTLTNAFTYAPVGSTTSLSSSVNPSSAGQAVTFTATITGFSPTGTVTFFDGGTQIGTATLSAGAATFTTSVLAVGTHSITARYGGDTNNVGSTSPALSQTVAAVSTTTSLSSSVNPSSAGQAVTFTATVTGFSPTGTVTFFDGGTQIGTATLAGGTGTFTTSTLTVGTHSITARYSGDANNAASTSPAVSQTVTAAATTTSLSSSVNPSSAGQPVTFTATVSGNSPTGTVTLFDGSTQIGTATLSAGAATFTTSALAVGTHSITARYSGDANNAASTSPAVSQTVAAVGATISLSSSPNPSNAGQPVTFTATVSGNSPTGTVTFFDGSTQIGTATLSAGAASFTTSTLAVGTHTITARYSGDTNNAASTSPAVSQTVAAVGATISLSSSPNPSSAGQPVTFTATVSGSSPTGTVTFFDGSTQIGTATLAAGSATFTTSALAAGTHSVTARYGGDASNVASTSQAVSQTVAAVGATISLSSSPNPSSAGQPVTFTASVSGSSPTGTVTFLDGGTQIGMATLSAGTASFTTSSLSAGSHSITARYSGDANNAASTALAILQTIAVAGTTTSLSSSPNPSNNGQAVRFTATVTGASPTGTVTFLDGGAQIGSAALAGGAANFTTASLEVGSHSITARYSGDPNNAASTSAALLQTVNVPADSIKLRELQDSTTPVIANIFGQAVSGAIDSAIGSGFSNNPPAVTPNGDGFNFQIPLDQPPPTTPRIIPPPVSSGGISFPIQRERSNGPGSLANGRQGGNGAPPGTRLIDMGVIPLPPRSGMPPPGETRFSPTEVVLQFGAGTTPQQIAALAQRFGLTLEAQQAIGMLGRAIYTFRIPNGQTVRQVIRAVEAARVNAAIQPYYFFALTQDQTAQAQTAQAQTAQDQTAQDQTAQDQTAQDQTAQSQGNPNTDQGDPAQYIINKFQLTDAHRITTGDKVVIAVIDSAVDYNQPNLSGAITSRYDAGCGASPPDAHGTGMAGAIAAHGQLEGVAPRASIIAICAFGGTGHPSSNTVRIINGLDYAIAHGARIVNMSFAGPRDPALSQALQIAREKGVLLIAAAGNAGPKSPPLYPGADPSVMAVTATDEHDKLFNGANQGEYVTVAAPGVNILVPAPDAGIQFTTGTSVATANVSGVAALLIAHKPSLTPEQIRALLVRTARHLGSPGMNRQFGAGLVDPLKALETPVSRASPATPATQSAQLGTRDGTQQDIRQASVDSFLASPDGNRKRVADGFSALGYTGNGSVWTKAPPAAAPHAWLAWIDLRGADFDRTTVGSDLKGVQVDSLAGITHLITPNFLVGVLGGYEHFDYSSQAYNGVLRGDGWTTGAYLGWRILPNLRFDAGGAWSDISADDTSGMATGSFLGQRWLITGGLTGTYGWQAFVLEPSARVFALWEHEDSYTDSLGTLQPDHNFSTGRASAGAKVTYPVAWTSTVNLAPYAGLYADYYFSMDDGATAGIATVPLLQGWSARATAGLAMTFSNSALLSLGGEYGGLGGDTHIWTWRVRGSVPF